MRNLIILMLTGILILSSSGCGEEQQATRAGLFKELPEGKDLNFLVISFDALRADGLGLYGYHRDTSPRLDKFAGRALVFEHAWAAAPVTPTSFAAAFTGLNPYRSFLDLKVIPTPTLAGLMQTSGRRTFGIFNNVQLARERNFQQGFDEYTADLPSDRVVLERANEALEAHKGEPFFGWVHFISPHTPYTYRRMSTHLAPLESEGRYARAVPSKPEVQSGEEIRRVRELYDGEIYYADFLFGKILRQLRDLDLLDNTVIVVTSDHGEAFMEHGQLGHRSVYEAVARIPMVIRHPRNLQGSRTDIPYSNVDLLPTLAAIAGIAVPVGLDGIDLTSPVPVNHARLITLMTNEERARIAIARAGYKMIMNCTPEYFEELYNLNEDPGELADQAEQDPDLMGELADAIEQRLGADPCELIMQSNRGHAPEELLNSDQIKQLKALGYTQ